MKTLCSCVLLSFAVFSYGATPVQNDADIAKAMVGTWTDAPSDNASMHGRITYYSDGHGVEFIWPAGQSESGAIRIDTQWAVVNQVLVLKSVGSSDPQKIPVGVELKDRIVSVTASQLTFELTSGYQNTKKSLHTWIRTENGSLAQLLQ